MRTNNKQELVSKVMTLRPEDGHFDVARFVEEHMIFPPYIRFDKGTPREVLSISVDGERVTIELKIMNPNTERIWDINPTGGECKEVLEWMDQYKDILFK